MSTPASVDSLSPSFISSCHIVHQHVALEQGITQCVDFMLHTSALQQHSLFGYKLEMAGKWK